MIRVNKNIIPIEDGEEFVLPSRSITPVIRPLKLETQENHITKEEAAERLKKATYAFLTGVAGSGKSFLLSWMASEGLMNSCVASTTGISAVNLGTQTINSWLKYFDTFSLKQNRYDGKLKRYIKGLASQYDSLVIDEVSMMDKDQLQVIYDEVAELNFERVAMGEPEFRLLITGDACQLPPVPGKDKDGKSLPLPWFFQADCWPKFEENTIKLTRVWRQSNPMLLDALNAIRSGNGTLGADLLLKAGVEFTPRIDPTFPGTTLIAKNLEVNKYNQLGLMRVAGETRLATTRSWFSGMKPPSEWKNIPGSHNPELDSLRLKKGAYVMILSNDIDKRGNLEVCCANCGEKVSQRKDKHETSLQVLSQEIRGSNQNKVQQVEEWGKNKSSNRVESSGILLSKLPVSVDQDTGALASSYESEEQGKLRELEGGEVNATRVCLDPQARTSTREEGGVRFGTPFGNGKEVGTTITPEGESASSECNTLGQSPEESRTNILETTTSRKNSLPILPAGFLDSLGCLRCGCTETQQKYTTGFSYVNGDCGTIKDWELDNDNQIISVTVELTRGKEVKVGKIVRDQLSPELPAHINKSEVATVKEFDESMGYYEGVVFSERAKRYVVAQIEYLPIRLGYASTVHKSQGLSLPLVQIDISSHFMSSPSMIYVALSRAQTIEGVKIVGNAAMLAKKTTTDPLVRRFI